MSPLLSILLAIRPRAKSSSPVMEDLRAVGATDLEVKAFVEHGLTSTSAIWDYVRRHSTGGDIALADWLGMKNDQARVTELLGKLAAREPGLADLRAAGANDGEVKAFVEHGLTSTNKIWAFLGERPNDGVTALATMLATVDETRLTELLVRLACYEDDRRPNWLISYWPLIVVLALLVLILLVYATY